MKTSPLVLRSTIIAALGGLLFGFDTAVISGTTGSLERVFQLTAASLGFTVAIALVGTVAGSIIAGKPADRFGRRIALLGIAALYAVSSLGTRHRLGLVFLPVFPIPGRHRGWRGVGRFADVHR